jgi:hypothetical protein
MAPFLYAAIAIVSRNLFTAGLPAFSGIIR